MTSNSELITWAIPGATWMLAFIAYVVLRVIETPFKRRFASIRRGVVNLSQPDRADLASTGYPRPQLTEPRIAAQS